MCNFLVGGRGDLRRAVILTMRALTPRTYCKEKHERGRAARDVKQAVVDRAFARRDVSLIEFIGERAHGDEQKRSGEPVGA